MRMPALSLSLAGIDAAELGLLTGSMRDGAGPDAATGAAAARGMIEWVRRIGYRAVQLNATWPGVRPRDLDRSGRRDLAALLRRSGLTLSGLDLWIPSEHFVQPQNADRAVSAVLSAIELAAELGTLANSAVVSTQRAGARSGGVVSVVVPTEMEPDALGSIADLADRRGVRIADHAWPARECEPGAAVGVGLDPAAVLIAGEDPAAAASRIGARLVSARLSNVGRGVAGGRVAAGDRGGKLDCLAYSVSLATAGYGREVVVDLRSIASQELAAKLAIDSWTGP